MSDYFDSNETLDPQDREALFFRRLVPHLQAAVGSCPGLAAHLHGIDPASMTSRSALAAVPVLRKQQIVEAQQADPPFGGFANPAEIVGSRLFMSPGPVWEPQGPGVDPWSSARALYAAGVRSGDHLHNAFSYHTTPGGLIIDEGARALGALVFPAGPANTAQQVEAMCFYRPSAFVGTPDYLKILLDAAEEQQKSLSFVKRALVSGGPLFPSLRDEYDSRGVAVLQAYATADLGVIAFETAVDGRRCEGMVCNEDLLVEIVRPGSGDPVPDGEVGELVVTTLNTAYPLVRFATGDLSMILPGTSACGRTSLRLNGWMGRADQRTKVRGMFVDPMQVDQLVRQFPAVRRARLVVSRSNEQDQLELLLNTEASLDIDSVEQAAKTVFNLRTAVSLVDQDLPNDGQIIADERPFD